MLRNLWEHFEVYIANFSLLLMALIVKEDVSKT